MSAVLDVRLPVRHALQAEIADHPARFKVVSCGRRIGKTELAKDLLIDAALDGGAYAYFAPTYRMVREMWDRIRAAAHDVIEGASVQDRRITLITGGFIEFWSLDAPDSTRGRAYQGVVVDEAAQVAALEYAWNEAIRPTLTDFRGWGLFLSTPRGRNFFWQLYQRGLDKARYPDWQSWQRPTTDNPYIDPLEVEAARRELPERAFQQEYLAEFLADGGAVFRNLTACATSAYQDGPEDGHHYFMGVDWGKSEDFTAVVVMDHSGRMVAMDRFNQIGWNVQRGRLIALAERWQPVAIWAETNAMGDPNVEQLALEGLPMQPFQTLPTTKAPLIDSLALAFEREEIAIVDDPVLMGELQAYTLERLPSGRFRYSAPEGMHDDTVIALALAWHGVNMGAYAPGRINYAAQSHIGWSQY